MEKILDDVLIGSIEDAEGSAPEADGEDIFYDSLETQVGETNVTNPIMTNPIVTYQCTEGSAPEVRTNLVGVANLGQDCVEGSPPGAGEDDVEGSPPGVARNQAGATSKVEEDVVDILEDSNRTPAENPKSEEVASKIGNWAEEVEQMKANEEDLEKNKAKGGRSEAVTSTPRKDLHIPTWAELEARKPSPILSGNRGELSIGTRRLSVHQPSSEAEEPYSKEKTKVHQPCSEAEEPFPKVKKKVHQPCSEAEEPFPKVKKKVRQPFSEAEEPFPKVKKKVNQPSSGAGELSLRGGPFQPVSTGLPAVQSANLYQISLPASGDGTVHEDWDSKKVLTEAAASMILGDHPEAGWMDTYKIAGATEVARNTAPFLLHSGVKDPTTLSQTLIQKKVGAEKTGVELEAMYFMNRKNRLDTQVGIEKYREKVLTSMPDSPAQDLELSKVEILRDYENKFFDEHEESILQKIKENEQQIELEAGKRDLIAFYEARVEMIETADEMKKWVQNGISEIRKMKARNMIPAAKKATFTKGLSEKVKEWTNRVSRILQTSFKVARKTRDEEIFHTPEIK